MPIRVALVDDYYLIHDTYEYHLHKFDNIMVIAHAMNGQEIVAYCRANPIDVILMDLEMPIMDGVEATALIHTEFPDIGIIALTGFENSERIEAALNAGACEYVTKSGNIKILADAIYKAVGYSTLADS